MSTHRLDPVLKLVGYCYDFLRGARSQAKGRLHLRRGAAKRGYLDIATLVSEEVLLFGDAGELLVHPVQETQTEAFLDDIGVEFEDLEPSNGTLGETKPSLMIEEDEKEKPFDILRRLYGLVQGNPHELEYVYGVLFLEGLDNKAKPILAPLVTVPVSVNYQSEKDAIRIDCEHDYARLNTYAIAELMSETYDAMEETLRDLVQLPLPLDPSSVQKVLRTLQTLGGIVDVPAELLREISALSELEQQRPVLDSCTAGRLELRRYAALAVVQRGNVFVLDDLAEMLKLPAEEFRGSLLARFALAEEGFEDNGEDTETSILGKGEILFPFAANDRQIGIAQAIERHGLVRVQGPPGTGKSQTIANLVCHLVARGKRVLVASQKQKAVEVIQDYLERLGIDFMPMTLLKGDREATRTLKSKLDGLAAFTFDREPGDLLRKAEEAENRVQELRKRMLDLEAELGRSLVYEVTPWGATGKKPGELAAEYSAMQEGDGMAEEESVAWGQQTEVVGLLERAVKLAQELSGHRLDLARLCESTKLPGDERLETLLQDLFAIRDALEREANLCRRELAGKVERLPLFPSRSSCVPEEMRTLRETLVQQIHRIGHLMEKEGGKATIAATRNHDQSACRGDLKAVNQIHNLITSLGKLEEDAAGLRYEGLHPEHLAEALEVYQAARAGVFRWLSPSFRKSKRIVAEALGRKQLTKTTDLSPVQAWVRAHRIRLKLSEAKSRRLSHLPIPDIPQRLDTTTERRFNHSCRVVKEGLVAREAACQLSADIAAKLGHKVDPGTLLDKERVDAMRKQVFAIERALEAKRAEQKARHLVDKWNLSAMGNGLQELAVAVQNGDSKKAESIVSSFHSLLPLVPSYRVLLALLEGPLAPWRKSAEIWIRQTEEKETADFHEAIAFQVKARALRTELSSANQVAPRESTVIVEESRRTEEQYRKAARETVEAYLHSQILAAYTKPMIGNDVRYFSRIIQKGKRNYEAFFKLKRTPRFFDAVLSVLPCWVATIQDIARVFPLRSSLFDIVIVDEASQCSIPSALPLFVRSQKAIVVGDDKQLPCVEGKFVSRGYNAELINRYGLYERLPRPESFNACETSLFDLAGSFTEKPIFLAEHFRCHPDIIVFSNKRFYDGRLIILTHGMDQTLGTPTEVVSVEGATDDPQARVNHREAEVVVRKLRELLDDSRYEEMDFGVCSPFRNQANLIWELIIKEFRDREIEDRKLISATADGFQGDERDVILYSFRFAPNSSPQIFTLAHGDEGQKRMNVAFTRPRKRAICFISHSIENFPPGLVRDFLRHAADPRGFEWEGEPWDSQFEKDVHAFLEAKALEVRPQVRACGYKLDFVLCGSDGRIAALEADGWEVHYPEGRLREEDIQRQRVLERAGWTVFRVHSREFYRDPEHALTPVLDYFAMDEQVPEEGEVPIEAEIVEAEALEEEVEMRVQPTPPTAERERAQPMSIPLKRIQEALLAVDLEPGLQIKRDELFRRALSFVGLQRLGRRVRARFQSALRGLIRRSEFDYRRRDVVWRLKTPQMDVFPSLESAIAQESENYELLKLLLEDKGLIRTEDASDFLDCNVSAVQPLLNRLVEEGFATLYRQGDEIRYKVCGD